MAEYIEREELINQIRLMVNRSSVGETSLSDISAKTICGLILEAPATDVVEVKHGEWIEHFNFDYWHYDCPFCDFGFATQIRNEDTPNYCENCGAKMDLKG